MGKGRWVEVYARDGRMSVRRTVLPTLPLAGLDWVILELEPILSWNRFTTFNTHQILMFTSENVEEKQAH